jgi:hypothetical protein
MVARWFYFQTKNPNFDTFWNMMENCGIFHGHLMYVFYEQYLYSVIILNILWSFWYTYFSQFWYVALRKFWRPSSGARGQFFKQIFEPKENFVPSQHWD